MRSGSPIRVAIVLAAVAGATGVAGCATTMQTAARLQLNSARIRASEVPTRVTVAGRAVRVDRVALVKSGGRTAFVVEVHNPRGRPVSDLPISVGVRTRGARPLYVNEQSPQEFSYFDSHLPVVAAGGTMTWVYTTTRRLPRRATPFALVGDAPSSPARPAGSLPVIRASALAGSAARTAGPDRVAIGLRNLSSVPQYQLQLYAFAQMAGRYVAAGNLTVPDLGSGSDQTLTLGLLGRLDRARVQVEALPTIFQ